jgi:AcrR family transcriptional regulator
MAEEVAMRGASSVTVARVIARARVSRRAFYEQFSDIDDCFLAAFDSAVEQMRVLAVEAYAVEKSWRAGIRSALAELLRFLDEYPLLAQLCIVHAVGGGTRLLEHRSLVIGELCEAIDLGRSQVTASRVAGPVVAEGVVGAVLAVLYTRLLARGAGAAGGYSEPQDDETPLIDLHGELMSLVLLPYLGSAVAGRELHKSPPPARAFHTASEVSGAADRSAHAAPGARLTYRTVCVLRAIAELPAASNREVAEHAGIVDQGQISKVLTRLEYQGLVVNRGGSGPARGTPNSWWLTPRGEALEQELHERPSRGRTSDPQPGKGSVSRRPAT